MPTLTADSMVARAILAANRPIRAAAAPVASDRMSRHETLEVWYDPQHAFLVTVGCLAIRAVTDHGRFCWLVRKTGELDEISYVRCPYNVTPPRDDDSGLQVPHPAVTELAASLRRGEIRMPLSRTDFRGSGGIMRRIAAYGMPGWLAAWLMLMVPRLDRVIWTGHRRHLEARRLGLGADAVAPGGMTAA